MRITKRHLNLIASHIAAAVVGAAIASGVFSYYWKDSVRGFIALSDLSVSGYYASLLDMQRDSANGSDYEQALRDYLKVLDNLLARNTKSEVYSTLAFDKTLTMARLALLREQHDGPAAAKDLFAAAVAQCESFRRGGDCAENSIREWVAYLDRNRPPFGPTK
jgi:hypothetical protein